MRQQDPYEWGVWVAYVALVLDGEASLPNVKVGLCVYMSAAPLL